MLPCQRFEPAINENERGLITRTTCCIKVLRRQNNIVVFSRLVMHIDDISHRLPEGHFDKNASVADASLGIDCEMQTGP